MENPTAFVPFAEFKAGLRRKANISKILRDKNISLSPDKAEAIRSYLVHYYSRIHAVSSYIDEDGQIWDCVPIREQPGLKGYRKDLRYTRPPGLSLVIDAPLPQPQILFDTEPGLIDSYGNPMTCPENCIPLRRLIPDSLLAAGELELTFQKGHFQGKKYSELVKFAPGDIGVRKYAYSKQMIACKGSIGFFNIWQPRLTHPNQVFSLSQVWLTAGTEDQFQSIEAGWIVYPQHFGTDKPVLFVYWTPDGYHTGNYNQDIPGTFVQTNSSIPLGKAIPWISQPMGQQHDIRIDWALRNSAWWLYINGSPIGYYPIRLFGQGPLARMASTFMVGGEVLGNRTWGQMGSGVYANQGHGRASYIRNINYIAPDGSIRSMQQSAMTPSPDCFRHQLTNNPQWQSGFFFGGPGGNKCL